MKATLTTPNTLFMSIYTKNSKSMLLGTLRGEIDAQRVMEDKGADSIALLLRCLEDARYIKADHLVIFTNDDVLLRLYRPPIRLEPTAKDRTHLTDARQWATIRHFCRYDSWQVVAQDTLPNAQKQWEEHYA